MTPAEYARLEELFHAAANCPVDERPSRLEQLEPHNAALREMALRMARRNDRTAGEDSPPLINRAMRAQLAARLRGLPDDRLQSVGAYTIVRRIGEGGFATVYLAEQTEPIRRRVAVKVLREGLDGAHVLSRFRIERQTLVELAHPNIVHIVEAGHIDDCPERPYFVMEYVDGRQITAYCDERGSTLRERLALVADLCDAVQHAHVRGIIHRDLKPSNVLVAETDSRPIPKIIDFGVARLVREVFPTDTSRVTRDGEMVGTLAYMSPEQLQGESDARSDIYALGVIAYQLITGRLPIDVRKRSLLDAARLIESASIIPPSQTVGGTDKDIDAIVLTALAQQPSHRYQSAGEFGADLRRYLAGEIVLAGHSTGSHILRRVIRRHRGSIAAAAAVLVALGALSAYALSERSRAITAESQWAARVEHVTRTILEDLSQRSGTLAMRRDLAANARNDALALLRRRPKDVAALKLAADACRQASYVHHEKREFAESLRLREEAADYRRTAFASARSDSSLAIALAIDLVLIGDVYFAQGCYPLQRKCFKESLVLVADCLQHEPTREHRDELAWAYQRLAACDLFMGQADLALQSAKESIRIAEQILSENPDHTSALGCSRQSHEYLAALATWQGDEKLQNEHHEAAYQAAERLYRLKPEKREHLAGWLQALTVRTEQISDAAEKRRRIESAYALAHDWHLADPYHPDALRYEIAFGIRLAGIDQQDGHPDDALAKTNRSLELLQRLPSAGPNDTWTKISTISTARAICQAAGDVKCADQCESELRMEIGRFAAMDSATPDLLARCAETLLALNQPADISYAARLAARAVGEANPPNAASLRILGRVYHSLNQPEAANASILEAARAYNKPCQKTSHPMIAE